jgi:hypothetical protein
MINQFEVLQEVEVAGASGALGSVTVVRDNSNADKISYAMKSFQGEKLAVSPFIFQRRGTKKHSEADMIHSEIQLMRKMVHPNLQTIRDVSY